LRSKVSTASQQHSSAATHSALFLK
jgi:hypothetical protein